MINDLSVYKFLAMKYFPFGIFGICVFFYCISASSVHVEHLVPLWYLTLYKRFLFLWKLLESLESWYSELFWYLVSPFNLDAHTFQLQEISWYYSSGNYLPHVILFFLSNAHPTQLNLWFFKLFSLYFTIFLIYWEINSKISTFKLVFPCFNIAFFKASMSYLKVSLSPKKE